MEMDADGLTLAFVLLASLIAMAYLFYDYMKRRKSIEKEELLEEQKKEQEKKAIKIDHSAIENIVKILKSNKYFTKINSEENTVIVEHQHTWTTARCFISGEKKVVKTELSIRWGTCLLMGFVAAASANSMPEHNYSLLIIFLLYLLFQYKSRPEDIENEVKKALQIEGSEKKRPAQAIRS